MIVISGRPGDLGNRLFVLAHFLAFGREYGVAICDLGVGRYAASFEYLKVDVAPRFPPKPCRISGPNLAREALFTLAYRASSVASRINLTRYGIEVVRINWEESLAITDPAFVALARQARLLFIQGWLFDGRPLLARHSPYVRRALAFDQELENRCASRILGLRATTDLIVGVHIRHGDYRSFLGGKYHFPITEYLQQMARFHELINRSPSEVAFVICSDEPQDQSDFEGFRYLYSGAGAAEDMCMLSQCDYIFGPPSTFSLWASFAGQVPHAMVVTPGHEFALSDFRVAESQMEFPEVEELLS